MGHFGLTQIIGVSNVSIAGYVGWSTYDTFLIVLLSGRSIYDPNPLKSNPNSKKSVSGFCRVHGLGRILTPLLMRLHSHKDTHKIKAFGLEIQCKFNENHNKDHKSVPFVLVEGKLAEKLS